MASSVFGHQPCSRLYSPAADSGTFVTAGRDLAQRRIARWETAGKSLSASREMAVCKPLRLRRCRFDVLHLRQVFQDGRWAHGLEHRQLLHLFSTRSTVATLPQVNSGTAHADQAPIVGCRQSQLIAVGGQPRRAEPVFALSRRLLPGAGRALAINLLHLLLQCRQFTSQFGNGASMLCIGLLQPLKLCTNFLAREPRDFRSENGCDVFHERIIGGVLVTQGAHAGPR